MGSSEIWDKYHSCCIGNGKTLVVFIPNFTATHAITSTDEIPDSKGTKYYLQVTKCIL